ncbi:MAG: hypothetical protein HRU28_10970 [Rhizobiales bacterium]|nr:hypothetical protein [Hyphomicrobiales bacterium]
MMDTKSYLKLILQSALDLYRERVEEPYPVKPILDVKSDPHFWALAEPSGDTVCIRLSDGILDAVFDVWTKTQSISDQLSDSSLKLGFADVNHAIDISLRWLLLHELNHFQIGHFKINGGACLVENHRAHQFSLTSRAGIKPSLISGLSPKEQQLAPLCMELQADHDSTEIILGAYSKDNWELFRFYASCIFVIMVLIEREESAEVKTSKTHPRAATRIFMLVGHLAELYTIPAHKKARREGLKTIPPEYLPPQEEIDGYYANVIDLVFSDAQMIAEAAGMPSIWNDLGGYDAIYHDVALAKNNLNPNPTQFMTFAGREWAELKPLNSTLLKLLGF